MPTPNRFPPIRHGRGPSRRDVLRRSIAAAAGIAGVTLAGCDRRRHDPSGRVTLEFFNYATPEFLDLYNNRLIPKFEASHPGVKIRMITSLGDAGYDAKLLTMVAGGLTPDLIHVTQQNFPFYAAKGVLMPVDEFARSDREFDSDALLRTVLDGMRYRDQLLGLPSDFSTICMLYNRTLFDEHGVEYPKPGWTWEDYLDRCRQLTRDADGDGYPDIYGTCNPNAYNRWPAYVWMNGGDIFSPDLTRCVLDSPQAIAGLQFYVDLSRRHRVAPTPIQSIEMEGMRLFELFARGRLGMMADSRYQYKRYLRGRGLPFEWDVAPMPRGAAGLATTFIWGGNCVMKGARHPREAWAFLKFLSGPEGAAANLAGGNALPAMRAAAEAEVARPSHPRVPPNDRLFIEALEHARIAPYPAQYADVTSAMSLLHDAFLGLKPVDQACRDVAAEVNRVLSGGVF